MKPILFLAAFLCILPYTAAAQLQAVSTSTNLASTQQMPSSSSASPSGMGWKDWIDLLQSLSVIIASGVAVCGIHAWRREFVGKRRIELAEEVLELFYEAQHAIASMRRTAWRTGEVPSRVAAAPETPEQESMRDEAHFVTEQWKRHAEVFSRLYALRHRFKARFGPDAAQPIDELRSIEHALYTAFRNWVCHSELDPKSHPAREEMVAKYEKTVWGSGNEDTISPRLEAAVQKMEGICRAQINR